MQSIYCVTFKDHVTQKCRLAMLNIKHIRSIRDYLDQEACEILVNGLVLSHLDYCNSILIGLPNVTINKLQRVQNIAAKLILKLKPYDSSTQALKTLHWLPIRLRIQFKIACTVHKCTFGDAPNYLRNLLAVNALNLRLRSSNYEGTKYIVPLTTKKTFVERSFSVQGPRIWNSLPDSLRTNTIYSSFKQKLKTYFFNLY